MTWATLFLPNPQSHGAHTSLGIPWAYLTLFTPAVNVLEATHTFLKGSAHLDRGDTRLPAHQDAATLERGHPWVLHTGVRSHEVGHVQQPVGSKQVGEAAATIKRVGRKGDKEAHPCALVLQVAVAGAPLSLLCGGSLRL